MSFFLAEAWRKRKVMINEEKLGSNKVEFCQKMEGVMVNVSYFKKFKCSPSKWRVGAWELYTNLTQVRQNSLLAFST
mgnify:CR=1 FL=1